MRLFATFVLGLILTINLAGFAFLAFGWFIGLDIHVNGGAATLLPSAVVSGLCVYGINRLRTQQAAEAMG